MRKRMKSISIAAAALGALAFGGSALATPSRPSSSGAPEKVLATDPGPAVQQGDQTTPDGASAAKTPAKNAPADPAGANDTTSPDTGSAVAEKAPENASEKASENSPEKTSENSPEKTSENSPEKTSETGPSDGPGGFADVSPTADTQQQGEH